MAEHDAGTLTVVKVGGSLFDRPDLGLGLRRWLSGITGRVLFVPGGGPGVEAIRQLDRTHQLGEEKSHWLALRVVEVNAHFLAALLPGSRVVNDPNRTPFGALGILDAFAFALRDESHADHLPHSWSVTSDSLAARAAVIGGAHRLVLLKSVTLSAGSDWTGGVDALFGSVMAGRVPEVECVNFREWLGAPGGPV